ncbi:NAD-dependent epimerase/dehydratase family protein [Chondromyces apiculatus]|uniref:Nucleoside-diphosphate-sugar epimerase n=1 Tax=Chondromyces apiculatus DSM 436 TaxID=1192034 RepID=A0A017TIX8_9BACT|nr:NAD-dependent epimerase/dehydratase family protein [Chondromyces apiculatus]EYF08805.1 Nucleoside-diphosphate-sugar epimerase [Chondromyces apiculatus DSM 436]
MNTATSPLHVVLGAGQVGARVVDLLLAAGHRVRNVRRGKALPARERLEHLSGDITDLAFAEEATRGAAVVYDCMNPAYHEWPTLLLPIARGALHGAAKAGAPLIALDCLYMYGRPSGPMREDTPMAPCSKKGALRVQLSDLRLGAHRKGDVRVAIGRASDFFGPDLPYSSWSDRFYERVLAGKPAECMGDPDQPHAYTYVPDVARALVTLGAEETSLGRVWHLPTPPAESTRALVARLGDALGVKAEVKRVPRLVLRGLGLFSPFMREVVEMTYQWEVPFVVDDSQFRAAFGHGATPVAEAVEETAAWARQKYGLQAAA